MLIVLAMDHGNYFDFDTALPPDDHYDQFHEEECVEFDALNDETFGSAAVELDWEEGHEKFANLKKAERNSTRKNDLRQQHNANILEPIDIKNLERDLSSLYAANSKRAVESSTVPETNILADCLLPSIPGKSIWSYDIPLKDKRVLSPNRADIFRSNVPEKPEFSRTYTVLNPPIRNQIPFLQKIKTVAELEGEMEAKHLLRQLGSNNNTMARHMDGNFSSNRLPYRQYLQLNSNIRNGMMGNYVNLPDQLKHGPRPPVNHYMMPPRPVPGLNNSFSNGRQWNPAMVGGNIFNQRFLNARPEVHNFPQNVSHFTRNHFNNMQSDRRYFDNSHYNQQQNYREIPKDDLEAEWEEWHRIRQNDPYAGLMNPKEKAWLKNIEIKQHTTENPYENDYYFVMLNLKKQKRKDQEIVKINGMQLMADKGRECKDYVPPIMPNSLGKLQIVSVNAPRKMIDLSNTHTESSSSSTPVYKELKKKRHVMMYIEKLCNIQIELDDLERKIRGLPDCPTRDSYKSKFAQLILKLWNAVTISENTLTQIFNIRKGRFLMSHLLDWLDESQLSTFFGIIFENLSNIMNEDENYLVTFWIQLDRFIANASQKHLLQLVRKLDGQLCSECNHDAAILSCKQFGLSVLLALIIRGEVLWSVMDENKEWPKFLAKAVHTLANFYRSNEMSVLPSLFITASQGHIRTQVNRCLMSDEECLKNALDATVLIESVVR